MVVDTAALVAILLAEPDAEHFAAALAVASVRLLSAVSWVDCFAYALAVATNQTLLFKGDDFSHTDIRPALPAAPAT
ncbi:MAG: type II toxin-antitoxin system VapC family toxin [Acetobacteraceae bacterium]|nr:type II toxin-antitoxin system VapC family toxin [Acetobacteraceae bacterium]